jgi:hypothetical protein
MMFWTQRRLVFAIATVLALTALGIVASIAIPYESAVTLPAERVLDSRK